MDFPKYTLTATDGATATIYQHGAHVTSWQSAQGVERLFLSKTTELRAGAAIRGGVPIIFPQFSAEGPLPRHGFARVLPWDLINAENGSAHLQLRDLEATRKIWAVGFSADYHVAISNEKLALTLHVTNTHSAAFTFTVALHTYLRVADITQTRIEGLHGLTYRDNADNNRIAVQADAALQFVGEVDRVYFDAARPISLQESHHQMHITLDGFRDVVTWNPGTEKGAALKDLEPDGYQRFVCIEAATIRVPITLQPNEKWSGTQMIASSH